MKRLSLLLSLLIVALCPFTVLADEVANPFAGTNFDFDADPYGTPPYRFERSRGVSFTVKTSPEVLRQLVPEPLTPSAENTISVVVVKHCIQQPLEKGPATYPYQELILAVPVTHGETVGSYFVALYLDTGMGIIGGRELYGFAKMDAEFDWQETENSLQVTVTREGHTLLEASAQLLDPLPQVPQFPAQPVFNLKRIPGVADGSPLDVKQLTSVTLTDKVVHELRFGQGEVVFGSTPVDPLSAIPVEQVVRTVYFEQDFVQGYGEVVHDYLADEDELATR